MFKTVAEIFLTSKIQIQTLGYKSEHVSDLRNLKYIKQKAQRNCAYYLCDLWPYITYELGDRLPVPVAYISLDPQQKWIRL